MMLVSCMKLCQQRLKKTQSTGTPTKRDILQHFVYNRLQEILPMQPFLQKPSDNHMHMSTLMQNSLIYVQQILYPLSPLECFLLVPCLALSGASETNVTSCSAMLENPSTGDHMWFQKSWTHQISGLTMKIDLLDGTTCHASFSTLVKVREVMHN